MFDTHPTTAAVLKKSIKTIDHKEYHHVAHFSSGGFAVTDKLRIFWTGDVSGESTLPTSKGLCFPDINKVIPTEFDYSVVLQIYKADKKAFKAFLEVAKLNYMNVCKVEIGMEKLTFRIETAYSRIEGETVFKVPIHSSSIIVDDLSEEDMENMNFSVNLEFLTDLFLNFEYNTAGFVMFQMQIKKVGNKIKYLVFNHGEYNYLVSLMNS